MSIESPITGLHMTSSKHDHAHFDQFPPNFDLVCKTIQHVSVLNLKLFGPMNTELWASEHRVTWENGLLGIILPTIMAATI